MGDLEKEKSEQRGLNVTDIINFCIMAEKYAPYIPKEEGIIIPDNSKIMENAADIIDDFIDLMKTSVAFLLRNGYKEDNIEEMKSHQMIFESGLSLLQELSNTFEIAVTPPFDAEKEILSQEVKNNG